MIKRDNIKRVVVSVGGVTISGDNITVTNPLFFYIWLDNNIVASIDRRQYKLQYGFTAIDYFNYYSRHYKNYLVECTKTVFLNLVERSK